MQLIVKKVISNYEGNKMYILKEERKDKSRKACLTIEDMDRIAFEMLQTNRKTKIDGAQESDISFSYIVSYQ